MKARDVVEMFLKGKSPAEIKEVFELEKEVAQYEKDTAEDLTKLFVKENNTVPPTPAPDPDKKKEEEGKNEEGKTEEGNENKEDEKDAKIKQLEEQLKAAQAKNAKDDMSGGKDPAAERQEAINNMVRSFM